MSDRDLLRLYIDDLEDGNEFFKNDTLDGILTDAGDDTHLAAARCWQIKAARVSDWYLSQTDGSLLARNQVFDHCKAMVDFHLNLSPGELVNVQLDSQGASSSQSVEF